MFALEHANITLGSFNVEVPLAEPILPPDPEWLREISPRLDSADGRMTALFDLSREPLDQWEPLCGDLSWTFELEGVPTADSGRALAQRFADGHQRCACRTSTERWTTFFYALNFGASPATTTTDGDYRVELSPDGALIDFAPDEPWGVTVRRFPAPGSEPASVWLVEAAAAQ